MSGHEALEAARSAVQVEAMAVAALLDRLDGEFLRAVDLVAARSGRVLVCGLGKSGHIGRKIAATLASLDIPAFFVHASEALHGDAGVIGADDVVIAISASGRTEEVVAVANIARQRGAEVISLTGCRGRSELVAAATVALDVSVEREADRHDLAPTASTTATLAMGDALAVAAATANGFSPEDFARHHPGGSLGRRLAPTGAPAVTA